MINSPIMYSGNVRLDPKNYTLSANLTISVESNTKVDEFTFIINKNFEIESINCEKLKNFEIRKQCSFPFAEEGNELILNLLNNTNNLIFSIQYSLSTSKIGSWGVNKITNNYTELGLYTPWYPYIPNQLVLYDLKILMKNDYQLTSLGSIFVKKGKYMLKSQTSEKSILLISAKEIFSKKDLNDKTSVNIFYFNEKHSDFAKILRNYSKSILNFFSSTISSLDTNSDFSIFIADRNKGGSYARNNSVIMQYIKDYKDKKEGLFRSLSHEIAHLWWSIAPTNSWEDWLNESFAEYFSLLAFKNLYDDTGFKKILSERKANFKSLPPIKNIKRTDDLAYKVLYHKGSVVLDRFSSHLGENDFILLCQSIYKLKLDTTSKVLTLVEEKFDLQSKNLLDKLLNT